MRGDYFVSDKTWKSVERAISRLFGGKRTGPIGKGVPDIMHPWLAIEVKSRKGYPIWLDAVLEQSETNARNRGFLNLLAKYFTRVDTPLMPIAVLHKVGRRFRNDIMICRVGEFLDRFVGGESCEDESSE